MIYKQRRLYSSFLKILLGTAIKEIHTSPENITFVTRKKSYPYSWEHIKKAVVEKKQISGGYPAAVTTETRILVMSMVDQTFRINVSRIRAEITHSSEFLQELKSHLKVTERRI